MPDTPAETLRAAAHELRSPTIPGLTPHIALMHPAFGEALADWLEFAAREQDATDQAARANWSGSGDAEARAQWIAKMTNHRALAVARALLGGTS